MEAAAPGTRGGGGKGGGMEEGGEGGEYTSGVISLSVSVACVYLNVVCSGVNAASIAGVCLACVVSSGAGHVEAR